jgi:hypothetical protein
MRGEGTCPKALDDNAEGTSHCIHRRVRKGDFVCCWCGDLFVGDDDEPGGRHGQYRPRSRRSDRSP